MKNLKKVLVLALAVIMMLSLVACGGEEEKSDEKKLVIGYTIYEPMNYMEDGKLTGFDTEFAEAVCKKLGMEPEFVEINWDTKFVTLDSNKIDCIWNGMTISPEVKKNCDVSVAYVKNAQVVVMKKDKLDKYKDVESMKGLKFTAEAGSAGEAAIKDKGLDGDYAPVAAQTDALLAVAGGQADACVIDITMAKSMTAKGTSYEDMGYAVELTSEEYGIGFRKGSDLTDKVNKAIEELKADGTLDALAEKYGLNLAL
ncbi:MAG: transporter substrate-binding domain-containing protein [Clostridia bacterium]|nr:transporter substrate-binding domain-containing protein [Clostridia bacterium]